jgi:tetratricopeptide (TPR) repeat protein
MDRRPATNSSVRCASLRSRGASETEALNDAIAELTPRAAPRETFSGPTGALLLVTISVVAFAPALFAGYIWDDDFYLTANPVLRHPDGLRLTWTNVRANPQFYPLVFTTYWLELRAWGLHPFGYHLVNVLLHAGSAILFWRLLVRLGMPWAWLAAAIFAVHPVCVESVAWITERKNTLSLFLYLAALSTYLHFAPLTDSAEPPKRRWGWYPVSLLLFATALLSKTVTCSLPAAIVLLLWWKRPRIRLRDLWPLIPMFALGLAAALVTGWLEQHHVRAKDLELGLSPVDRALLAGRAVWFYATKIVAPINLTFIYPQWKINASDPVQYIYPLAALLVLIALWSASRRIGRGPLVAALLYVGTLVPALGFVDVYPFRYSWVADHFQYHASLALIAALVAGAYGRVSIPAAPADRPVLPDRPAPLPTVLLLGVLGALTFNACRKYRDAETLWRDTLARNESAWIAHNNLGALLSTRGQFDEAERHLRRSLELNTVHSQALNNLAYIALVQGRPYQAIELCEQAMKVRNAELREVYNNYGLALSMLRRHDEAIDKLRESLRIDSTFVPAHVNLAKALIALGRDDEARDQLDQVHRLNPFLAEPYLLWGDRLADRGRTDEALAQFEAAVRADPGDGEARLRLARSLEQAGRAAGALPHAAMGARIHPGRVDARALLGRLLLKTGNAAEAIPQLEFAVQLDPGDISVSCELAAAYAATGRYEDARSTYARVLLVEPDRPGVREALEAVRSKLNAGGTTR